MLSRRRFLVLAGSAGVVGAATVAGVAALPSSGAGADGFPVIRYGAERCARCGMIIDDVRFASAWTAAHEANRHFDDIGCLVRDVAERPSLEGMRFLVHDYETEQWLDASSATFVVSTEVRTPMAYGIAAVATSAAAERLVREFGGGVTAWAALGTVEPAAAGRAHS
jgi:copper chaperone NosL